MPYVNNAKLMEIRSAAKQGNEKAMMFLQAMRKFAPQEDLDRLMDDYYGVGEIIPSQSENPLEGNLEPEKEEISETLAGNVEPEKAPDVTSADVEKPIEPQQDVEVQIAGGEEQVPTQEEVEEPSPNVDPLKPEDIENPLDVVDLTDTLDKEMDGLLDENELEDLSFGDFLKNKSRDGLRMKKNADYFKAYDSVGRKNYMTKKADDYKNKFNGRISNINRHFNDNEIAINGYLKNANDFLDDDFELDMENANSAYNDFIQDENTMNSFGRHWDKNDNGVVTLSLQDLTGKYGKKNVIAALNTLKSDNQGYRDFLNNQVDEEINRYSKSLEKLLK